MPPSLSTPRTLSAVLGSGPVMATVTPIRKADSSCIAHTTPFVAHTPGMFTNGIDESPSQPENMGKFPHYCPICMLHYRRLYTTVCCSNNICEPCGTAITKKALKASPLFAVLCGRTTDVHSGHRRTGSEPVNNESVAKIMLRSVTIASLIENPLPKQAGTHLQTLSPAMKQRIKESSIGPAGCIAEQLFPNQNSSTSQTATNQCTSADEQAQLLVNAECPFCSRSLKVLPTRRDQFVSKSYRDECENERGLFFSPANNGDRKTESSDDVNQCGSDVSEYETYEEEVLVTDSEVSISEADAEAKEMELEGSVLPSATSPRADNDPRWNGKIDTSAAESSANFFLQSSENGGGGDDDTDIEVSFLAPRSPSARRKEMVSNRLAVTPSTDSLHVEGLSSPLPHAPERTVYPHLPPRGGVRTPRCHHYYIPSSSRNNADVNQNRSGPLEAGINHSAQSPMSIPITPAPPRGEAQHGTSHPIKYTSEEATASTSPALQGLSSAEPTRESSSSPEYAPSATARGFWRRNQSSERENSTVRLVYQRLNTSKSTSPEALREMVARERRLRAKSNEDNEKEENSLRTAQEPVVIQGSEESGILLGGRGVMMSPHTNSHSGSQGRPITGELQARPFEREGAVGCVTSFPNHASSQSVTEERDAIRLPQEREKKTRVVKIMRKRRKIAAGDKAQIEKGGGTPNKSDRGANAGPTIALSPVKPGDDFETISRKMMARSSFKAIFGQKVDEVSKIHELELKIQKAKEEQVQTGKDQAAPDPQVTQHTNGSNGLRVLSPSPPNAAATRMPLGGFVVRPSLLNVVNTRNNAVMTPQRTVGSPQYTALPRPNRFHLPAPPPFPAVPSERIGTDGSRGAAVRESIKIEGGGGFLPATSAASGRTASRSAYTTVYANAISPRNLKETLPAPSAGPRDPEVLRNSTDQKRDVPLGTISVGIVGVGECQPVRRRSRSEPAGIGARNDSGDSCMGNDKEQRSRGRPHANEAHLCEIPLSGRSSDSQRDNRRGSRFNTNQPSVEFTLPSVVGPRPQFAAGGDTVRRRSLSEAKGKSDSWCPVM